jgi:hypothetical protein
LIINFTYKVKETSENNPVSAIFAIAILSTT